MKKGNILIVDDMSTHLLLLQTILEEEGYETIILNESSLVLDTLYNKKIDIVLLDIMMPGMDGLQVLDKIKKEYKYSKLPVVIISAKNDSRTIQKALEKGAFDYLTKPINVYDLKNKVQTAFDELEP